MKYIKRTYFTIILPFAMVAIIILAFRDIWWRGEADDSSYNIWSN